MDFGTKVRVAVALLLFTDALFRLLFANIRLPAIPIVPLPSRKRTREDEDDDFEGLIEGGAVCLGMKRRRFWCARHGHGVWDDEIIANWNVKMPSWLWLGRQLRFHVFQQELSALAFHVVYLIFLIFYLPYHEATPRPDPNWTSDRTFAARLGSTASSSCLFSFYFDTESWPQTTAAAAAPQLPLSNTPCLQENLSMKGKEIESEQIKIQKKCTALPPAAAMSRLQSFLPIFFSLSAIQPEKNS